MEMLTVTRKEIANAVSRAGLAGRSLCVHSSLSSFGLVGGGPQAVIDGLLDQGCTVMVPTFSWAYAVQPPADDRPARNGWDYDSFEEHSARLARAYSPDSDEIDTAEMGAVPTAVLAMNGRARGDHPLCSFSAVGPDAAKLVDGQTPVDVFAPLQRLSLAKGFLVLMGVGLTKLTALHLAEQMAGRKLFRRWARGPDDAIIQTQVGGCSSGFDNLEATLSPAELQIVVGRSLWRIYPADSLLGLAAEAIRAHPMLTHCGKRDCRCDDAVAGGPIV